RRLAQASRLYFVEWLGQASVVEQLPMKVFVLYFMGPSATGEWFGRFLGVYSSQLEALRAIERLQGHPGYRHYPQGFQAECVELDVDHDQPPVLGPPPPPPLPPPC